MVSFDRYARWKITAVHFSLRHSSLHCHQPSSISRYLDIQHVGIVIRYNTTSVSSEHGCFFFFLRANLCRRFFCPSCLNRLSKHFFIKDVRQVEGQQHHVDEHMLLAYYIMSSSVCFLFFFSPSSFFNLPPTPAAL